MPSNRSAFISHSHADNALCDEYISLMINKGLDIWYDRIDMQLGPLLYESIGRELERRTLFILMMTEASLSSFWVRYELGMFLDLMSRDPNRSLVPVKIGNCVVPPQIAAFPWVDGLALSKEDTIKFIARAFEADIRDKDTAPINIEWIAREAALVVPVLVSPVNTTMDTIVNDSRLDFLPDKYNRLGYAAQTKVNGVRVIIPPVCEVLPGIFKMGTNKSLDRDAFNDEIPLHTLSLNGFRITRFPITVAEYDLAVKAQKVKQPDRWNDQLLRPDHPVVYVSWDDAIDYANWLSEQTGDSWRLPTEAEWEKAARWDELTQTARRYPWGDVWDSANANTKEQNRHGTTPIGNFLPGASPCGVLDMSGNVSEWTSSLYRNYPYDPYDGREDPKSGGERVIRGGSWHENYVSARTTFRIGALPVDKLNYRGFRLAISGLGVSQG